MKLALMLNIMQQYDAYFFHLYYNSSRLNYSVEIKEHILFKTLFKLLINIKINLPSPGADKSVQKGANYWVNEVLLVNSEITLSCIYRFLRAMSWHLRDIKYFEKYCNLYNN